MRKGNELRERTFRFACRIVELHDRVALRGASAQALGRQMLNAGTSIYANLEEADAAQSRADFVSKCSISLKESRETLGWLRLLHATGKFNPGDSVDEVIRECDEIVAILTTIVRKTKAAQ